MSRAHELRLIARVAQMYHIDGIRQADIAQTLRISQATISRMLKRAVTEDIVRTTIVAPLGTYGPLESVLRAHFNLPEVIIVDSAEDRAATIMPRIGEAAAHYLETTLQPDEVIGVSSFSETIQRMVENIHPMRSSGAKYVVQTLGGRGNPAAQTHATQLTTRLAHLTGAVPHLLGAPGIAHSPEARQVWERDPFLRETMALFDQITLAFIGIGAIEPGRMLAGSGNVFSPQELVDLTLAGAVGNIGLRFINAAGEVLETPLDDRVIGMTMAQLAKVDRVVALAGGQDKTRAIQAALHSGLVDVLITDHFTARRIMDLIQA